MSKIHFQWGVAIGLALFTLQVQSGDTSGVASEDVVIDDLELDLDDLLKEGTEETAAPSVPESPELAIPDVEVSVPETDLVEELDLDIPEIGEDVPELAVPAVAAPAVEAPELDLLEVPELDVPAVVDVPEVDVPVLDIPEVDVPEVEELVVDVPEVDVPVLDVPEVDVPEVEELVVDVPEVDVPVLDVPEVDVPEVEELAVDVPEVDVPVLDVPEVDFPEVKELVVDVPEVEVPALDVPVVEVPVIDEPVVAVPAIEPEQNLDDLLSDDTPVALDDLLLDDPLAPAPSDDPLAVDVGLDPVLAADPLAIDPLASGVDDLLLPDLGALDGEEARAAVGTASASDLLGTISDQNEPSTSDFIESEVQAERARREAQLLQGISNLKLAHQHFDLKQYDTSSLLYEEAIKNLGKNPRTIELWAQAREGFGRSKYRVALGMFKSATGTNDLEKAKQEVISALRHDTEHVGAQKLKKEIEEAYARILKKIAEADRYTVVPRNEQNGYREKVAVIEQQMKMARAHVATREFDKAKGMLESVLALDPVNGEAIRLLHHISSRRNQMAREERDSTVEDMMFEVASRWSPKNYHQILQSNVPDLDQGKKITNVDRILEKMRKIVIPQIAFRDANIRDVVQFLVEQSIENDAEEKDQQKKGVSIILKLSGSGGGGGSAPAPAPTASADPFAVGAADPFAAAEGDAAAGGGGGGGGDKITFTARYISLLDALDIITEMTSLKYRINQNFIMLVPKDDPEDDLINRTYTVEPVLIESLRAAFETVRAASRSSLQASDDLFGEFGDDGGGGGGGETDMQGMFGQLGVDWPTGSQIAYVDSLNKLFVANTLNNLNTLERVLVELDVVPKQVEIETRFVEVAQTDLDALGFEWLLTDDWEISNKKSSSGQPFARNQKIVGNQNAAKGGYTRGNRFWGVGDGIAGPQFGGSIGMLGDIASFSSVLTNPELTVVLHALEQSGRADTLSAPRITTMPGVDAEIKVVTEYIYPTEFEVTPVTGTTGGGAGGGPVTQTITGGIVEPSAFETREVGVILQVTPDVSPDGARISLQMSPEVVTEPEWFEYGSIFTDAQGNQTVLSMRQPFFHSRRLTTTITIYDGATVVMGGMITESLTTIDDKIPILGDIPGLGTFFSSKAENSVKRNLLIFVTARLVDPSGQPIRKVEDSDIINPLKVRELAERNK